MKYLLETGWAINWNKGLKNFNNRFFNENSELFEDYETAKNRFNDLVSENMGKSAIIVQLSEKHEKYKNEIDHVLDLYETDMLGNRLIDDEDDIYEDFDGMDKSQLIEKLKETIEERDQAIAERNMQSVKLNHIGCYLKDTLGFSWEEILTIGNMSFEVQDIQRELRKINETKSFEEVRLENRKKVLAKFNEQVDDILNNDDIKETTRNRWLAHIREDMQRYFSESKEGMPLEAIELYKKIGRIINS